MWGVMDQFDNLSNYDVFLPKTDLNKLLLLLTNKLIILRWRPRNLVAFHLWALFIFYNDL